MGLSWLCIWFRKIGCLLVADIVLEKNALFVWSLSSIFLLVAKGAASVLSCATWAHSIVILGIESSSNTWLMHLIPWIGRLIVCIFNILLELRVILILHWNLLNILRRLIVVWVQFYILLIAVLILVGIIQIASLNRLSTLILRLLSTHYWSDIFIFFFHIGIKYFSFFKDFHQLGINLITIQLLQNAFLMIKLILWLLGLLSSLLLLNKSVSIFWTRWCFFDILSVRLSSSFCWLSYWWLLTILTIIFVCTFFFAKLVFVIDYMHRQTLVW